MHLSKLLLSLIATFVFLACLVAFTSNVKAENILFQDDFENGLSNNWHVIRGTWSIATDPTYPENGNWLKITSPSGADNEIQVGDFGWQNYRLSFDILPKSGADRNIFFRVNNLRTNILSGHDLPVSYSLQPTLGSTYLGKWTPTSFGGLPGSTDKISLNGKSHFDIDIDYNTINIYLNNIQIINYIDFVDPILNGRIAFAAITGSDPSEVLYDNVVVTEITHPPSPSATPTPNPTSTATPTPSLSPSPTPTYTSLQVPDIKQYNLPWGSHIYDTAFLWSTSPTISRWGCALTSAVMVLNYYGHNITPDTLNSWLKSQPDGYLGSGLINWLAISRYSRLTSTALIPSLEYLRYPGSTSTLTNELNNGRPVIVDTSGHFVVATGLTESSFKINDPAFSNRHTLEAYGNSMVSIGSYIPSHTDLSYLLITADPNLTLLVKNSQGKTVQGEYFVQHALVDDIEGKEGGQELGIFVYPKPTDETYQIEISGNNHYYKITTYVYDNYGNVDIKTVSGKLKPNTPSTYNLRLNNKKLKDTKKHHFHFSRFLWQIFRH